MHGLCSGGLYSEPAGTVGVHLGRLDKPAGLAQPLPHSYRKTLARLGERLCRSPEEWKAWSQNLGHESEATTFVGYGEVPSYRQAEIMRTLTNPRPAAEIAGLDIRALETFLKSAKGGGSL
jgi:hypothetical protein